MRGVYKVIVRAWHEEVTRVALFTARDLVMAAIEDRPFDVPAAVDNLRRLVDEHCLGPSTACIVDAADDRDIPAIRLSDGNLVQLGYARASAASGRPRPTAPAPSAKASRATRT